MDAPNDSSTGLTGIDKPQLVGMVYDVLMHPEKLEQLFSELSSLYDVSLAEDRGHAISPDGRLLLTLEGIENHLDQVAKLFERMGRQYRTGNGPEKAIDEDLMLVDRFGAVQADPDRTAGAVARIASIFDLQIDSDVAASIRAQLAAAQGQPLFSVVPVHNGDGSRTYWALTGIREPSGSAVAQLRRMNFGWSDAAGQVVIDAFSLTPSEQDILRFVVDGKSLAELAAVRGRSIETVRTQAKALLTKTGVKSQLELVRMFAAVSLAAPDIKAESPGVADRQIKGNSTVRARDGRNISVEVAGPAGGRPVLFLHNLFGGPTMTRGVTAELERRNIRLVCPWRPGYFDATSWKGSPKDLPQIVATDLEAVMDSYGIGRTIAVGHMSGAVHAAAAAALLPDRIAGAIAVAGFVPFIDRQQIDRMANWPRLYAYAARYVPTALAVLIRGTLALLRDDKPEVLFDGLFRTSAADCAAIADPEIRRVFRGEFDRSSKISSAGYELDAVLSASDWSGWFRRPTSAPMTFIHGDEDQITLGEQLRYVAERLDNVTPVFVPDAGSLLLFQKPELVVGMISDLLEERLGG